MVNFFIGLYLGCNLGIAVMCLLQVMKGSDIDE